MTLKNLFAALAIAALLVTSVTPAFAAGDGESSDPDQSEDREDGKRSKAEEAAAKAAAAHIAKMGIPDNAKKAKKGANDDSDE